MKKEEKMIGEICLANAKNKDQVMKFLGKYKINMQERRLRDKAIDKEKKAKREETFEKDWN